MGEGQEDGVEVIRQLAVDGETGRGEVRVVTADRLVVAVAPGEADDQDVGMPGEQADELRPDVPGRADDADPQSPDPVVTDHTALAAGWEPRRAVRRDPDRRLEPCAHGRTVALRGATLLTGSGLGSMAGSGWTVVMGV